MGKEHITIRGAREHNLKSINVNIPRNKLTVITGVSGSGKSSLAFDTVYADGQRKFVESLSAYARQFLEQMQKPDVDYIEGLSPTISIQQRAAGGNPRSTVGTTTEIYDYLRLLFARVGEPYCYKCGRKISSQSPQEIVEHIFSMPFDTPIMILAPIVRGRKGEYIQLFQKAKRDGFVRVRVDRNIYDLSQKIKLNKKLKHNIEIIVDRLILKKEIRQRLADSVETALKAGEGLLIVAKQPSTSHKPQTTNYEVLYSTQNACPKCGISYGSLEPRMFSFNSPYGACPGCGGLGHKMKIDPDLIIPDKSKSLRGGAIEPWRKGGKSLLLYYHRMMRDLSYDYGFDLDTSFNRLPKKTQGVVLYGSEEQNADRYFEGIIPNLERRFRQTESEYIKNFIYSFMSMRPCPQCKGNRLKQESLAVKIDGKNIADACKLSIIGTLNFIENLKLSKEKTQIARLVLKELKNRLHFLINVGLNYLTLDRMSQTLSGGEAQRIRLATQIGAGLVGVLYVLDEPSIGLHQRDNSKLLDTLYALRDLGNTVLVVEHDESTIRNADYIIDLGPGAGKNGGEVVYSGSLKNLLRCKGSLTAKYMNGELSIPVPEERRPHKNRKRLIIKGAREHNLKNIDVEIPLGVLTCISGVSGSGKSTLIDEVLYRALARKFYRSPLVPGKHERIVGVENIDRVIVVDQSPIGRTPRSNPATYTGVFSYIRDIFSRVSESRMRGYKPGRFSFNVKGGRCDACNGDGVKKIEMHFLPDVYIMCQVCKGKRFNRQTLEVKFKGKNIADVLEMTVDEAYELFKNIPRIKSKLKTLIDVGLGYIQVGQSATTLSGGEAQRVKLSAYLGKRATGNTLYILDEPTTGLHFDDVHKLLSVLNAIVEQGNSVIVIEHHLDVLKSADYLIDLGPEGGDNGGEIVACGSPEEVTKKKKSFTGQYLKKIL
ncbi:MAG: excinuclease ABC subunit UvrA [Candidatus Omnitrophota bacterium]|nr:MAG: excinuclease ABC subunit UvrA [Candidatus Omnitrophota bacterium]